MSLRQPPFRYMVQATGHAEVWTHNHEDFKFRQYGWRCHTNENAYEPDTLVGNWSEERADIRKLQVPESLPSQFSHYFNPIYNSSFNKKPIKTVPKELKHLRIRHPHSFPAHQPELDTPKMKAKYNSWETTMRVSYMDPSFREQPVKSVDKSLV